MHYSFATIWRIPAPLPPVWEAIFTVDQWPTWWKSLEKAILLEPSKRSDGVGALRRLTFKGRLPYRMTFETRVTKVNLFARMESQVTGECEGTGIWTLALEKESPQGRLTVVRYDWNVRTTKPWMNLTAPLAWPLFRWNHDEVMRQGGEGLTRHLTQR